MVRSLCLALVLASIGCNNSPKEQAQPEPLASGKTELTSKQTFGAPIQAQGAAVTLADVAASPDKYKGQAFVVEGTVGSVCQHRGCWMTLSDDQGEAFIRMQNHAFLIPKDSAGKKARVMATLEDIAEPAAGGEAACGEGKGHGGCKAEAEKATGKPLAKLELQATGVELF